MSNYSSRAVLTPYPIDKAYDYALPEGLNGHAGSYVCVPLGSREIPAVIWGDGTGDVKPEKIKPIIANYHLPPLPDVHRKFLDWVAAYTMAPKGAVLKLTLSVPKALEPPASVTAYVLGETKPDETGVSPQAKKVLQVAADNLPRRASELASEAGCSTGVVKTLYDKGFLKACAAPSSTAMP